MRAIDGDRLKRKAQKVATEAWKMKIKANVETILNEFMDWIDDAPTIEPEPHWIQCSERLPKIGDRVIGTYKNSLFKNGPYVVRIMRREKKYWVGDDEHWFLYENIFAWQPLPEPYKEGES